MNWLDYLRERVAAFDFQPWQWDGADPNVLAFTSKERFARWYGQPPGPRHIEGVPSHRDESFYVRELARVSMLVRPKRIVELGTCQGIGTTLLHILNPSAELTTVDIASTTMLPGGEVVPIGYLAKHQKVPARFVHRAYPESWDFLRADADLYFIDADHSYEAVCSDQYQAWANRNKERGAIVWHDHNERHPGTMQAVAEFCRETGLELRQWPDSCTVWVDWEVQ